MSSERADIEAFIRRPGIHEVWESAYLTPDCEPFYELQFDQIAEWFAEYKDAVCLDAGCGLGYHALRLAERGFRVHAIDLSEEALKRAQQRVNQEQKEGLIEFAEGNICAMQYPDNHFQLILCYGVLMHIKEVDQAIAELARVLKPGGLLVISETNMNSLQLRLQRVYHKLKRPSKSTRVRTAAGLEYWREYSEGTLLTRQANIGWIAAQLQSHGLAQEARCAGQFSEVYTHFNGNLLSRMVHAWNRFWFKRVRWPGPALGNMLLFRKKH